MFDPNRSLYHEILTKQYGFKEARRQVLMANSGILWNPEKKLPKKLAKRLRGRSTLVFNHRIKV